MCYIKQCVSLMSREAVLIGQQRSNPSGQQVFSPISGLRARRLRPARWHFKFSSSFCYETMSNCSQNCWIDWNSAVLCFKRLFHIGYERLPDLWGLFSSHLFVHLKLGHRFHAMLKVSSHRDDIVPYMEFHICHSERRPSPF